MNAFQSIFVALCAISLLVQSTLLCNAYVLGPRAESWRLRNRFYIPLDQSDEQTQPFGFNSLWASAPFNKKDDTPFASGYGKIEAPAAAPQPGAEQIPPVNADDQQLPTAAADSSEESRLLAKWAKYLRKEQQQQQDSLVTTESITSTTAASPVVAGAEQALPPLRRVNHDEVLIRPIGRNIYQVREGQRLRPVRVELGEVEEVEDLPSLSI